MSLPRRVNFCASRLMAYNAIFNIIIIYLLYVHGRTVKLSMLVTM